MGKIDSDKRIFPDIAESSQGKITKDERYTFYYPVVKRYLKNRIKGLYIWSFFEKNNMINIVLYAANELAELICMDMEAASCSCEICYVCDKQYQKFPQGFCGKEVYSLDKLVADYQMHKVDKIIICNLLREHEIYQDLMQQGVDMQDILTVADVVFDEE